ncbi:MAG: hypothetical protein ACETVY_00220 [Candidatus Bathyarchaeia archaeon]
MLEPIGPWLTALFLLSIFSFAYKENSWFRFAEHTYLGIATAYGIGFNLDWLLNQWNTIWSLTAGKILLFALALLIGLLFYFRFSRQYFFLYRIPLAIGVGTYIGLALRTMVFAQFLTQIKATFIPLVAETPLVTFNNILTFVMIVSVLVYFYFTAEHRGPLKYSAKIARYTMMAGFGSAYGNTVMTRMGLFIGQVRNLLAHPPSFAVFGIAILGSLLLSDYMRQQRGGVEATTRASD